MIRRVKNYTEWIELLTQFKEKVSLKIYSKVDYAVWRNLNSAGSINSSIRIDYDENETITICIADIWNYLNEQGLTFIFKKTDYSFGQFLYDTFFIEFTPDIDCDVTNLVNGLKYFVDVNPNGMEYLVDSNGDTIKFNDVLSVKGDTNDSGYTAVASIDQVNSICDTKVSRNEFNELKEKIDNYINNENKKENNAMKFNFDFGSCEKDNVRMSMYGLAIKNAAGTYVSYNPNTNEIVDVDIFNFDGGKYLYKMPVAVKDVAVGDVIIHARVPMYVSAISADQKTITAIDVYAGETKNIMLARSPFGFNFVTKVVNLFGGMLQDNAPNETNPFGNMWMLMMLSNDNSDNKDMKDMLPFMLMAQGGNVMNNPLMMYFLMGDKAKDNDMLLPLMLMNQGNYAIANPMTSVVDNAALDVTAVPTL